MRKIVFVAALWAAGCCTHKDVAVEAMRINMHLAETATTVEGRSVATKNYRLWAGVAGVTSVGR